MQLNQLQFVARSRQAYEVFDLAILMYRQHLWRLLLIYAVMLLPMLVISLLLLPLYWVGFILWWFKPLLERPLLHYLAKAAFKQPASLLDCLKSLKQLNWLSMLLKLTLFRLSPYRAFYAAIDQLEGLTGKAGSERKQLLQQSDKPKPILWTVFCVHFEAIILLALASICYALLPNSYNADALVAQLTQNSDKITLIYTLLYAFSITLLAPLYVAGGFLSYLHRRIDLEGWDIELEFRAINQRLQQKKSAKTWLSCCLPILFLFSSYWPSMPVNANDIQPQQVQQQIEQLYKQEGVMEKVPSWNINKDQSEDELDIDFNGSGLMHLADALAYIIWFIAAAILIWLIYFLSKHQGFFKQQSINIKKHKKSIIQPLFTNIEHNIDPKNLLNAAINAEKKAQHRLALAYLIQHILICAQQQYDIHITTSMTENECLQQLKKQIEPHNIQAIQQVFDSWIHLAWAHKQSHYQFTQLLADLPTQFTQELADEN